MLQLRHPSPRRLLALVMLAALLPLPAFLLPGVAPGRPADGEKPAKLELRPGDHVCIIGNTLADRMQHDGWLETYLQGRFPTYHQPLRNVGFSGDEVAGYTSNPDTNRRLRSMSFGTGDQWLAGSAPVPEPSRLITRIGVRDNRLETTNTRADVIFAFFGYNES